MTNMENIILRDSDWKWGGASVIVSGLTARRKNDALFLCLSVCLPFRLSHTHLHSPSLCRIIKSIQVQDLNVEISDWVDSTNIFTLIAQTVWQSSSGHRKQVYSIFSCHRSATNTATVGAEIVSGTKSLHTNLNVCLMSLIQSQTRWPCIIFQLTPP